MVQLLEYVSRVAPGVLAAVVLLVCVPRELAGLRLAVHVGLFMVLRDGMTPVGLWRVASRGVWLTHEPVALLALAAACGWLALGTFRLEPRLSQRITWLRGHVVRALSLGLVGGCVIAAPAMLLGWLTPSAAVGGGRSAFSLVALFVFSLVGNAYEELLFRGFLQELVAERVGAARAAWIAGLAFAFGHAPLAVAVTDVGAPLLIFTAYEGLICAQLARRCGLASAIAAHGLGIFFVAASSTL
ncbi:MAG: CPBP family intramembrane glutamic endopeptidase [Polyangiales bacterium]